MSKLKLNIHLLYLTTIPSMLLYNYTNFAAEITFDIYTENTWRTTCTWTLVFNCALFFNSITVI